MEIRFYRCIKCYRPEELNYLLHNHICICGSSKISPTYMTNWELLWFAIQHPIRSYNYLKKAYKGEKLYVDCNDTMPNS